MLEPAPSGDSHARFDRWERLRNALLGATLLFWSGVAAARPDVWMSPVRIVALGMNAIVAVLLVVRRPARQNGTWRAIVSALPSLGVGFWAAAIAPPPDLWSWTACSIFVVGAVGVVAAFTSLGRNFAILPALRGIVVSGPYQLVRHPAYAAECILLASCFVAGPSWWTAQPLAIAIPFLVVRIRAAEALLHHDVAYSEYCDHVRWRLVPFVW